MARVPMLHSASLCFAVLRCASLSRHRHAQGRAASLPQLPLVEPQKTLECTAGALHERCPWTKLHHEHDKNFKRMDQSALRHWGSEDTCKNWFRSEPIKMMCRHFSNSCSNGSPLWQLRLESPGVVKEVHCGSCFLSYIRVVPYTKPSLLE